MPDETTEIELNIQNTGRWKIAFQELTATNGLTVEKFTEEVKKLANLNRRNPSIENIFFEASKFISSIDRESALTLYIYYLYHDLQSVKFDNKQLTKTIQKNLFSSNEQLRQFEMIISDYINTRDLEKALLLIPGIYIKKRKQISLNTEAIKEARSKHSHTVELLNEYLHDEFEDDQNAIVSREINNEEVQLEITSKIEAAPSVLANRAVNLNQAQFELLQLFAKSSFCLPQSDVETFARTNGLFRNQLIESVNEICYEVLDDVLIEEDEEFYITNENYFRTIIHP